MNGHVLQIKELIRCVTIIYTMVCNYLSNKVGFLPVTPAPQHPDNPMIFAIISPFTAIFAVSLIVLFFLLSVAMCQLHYDLKHPDRKIDRIVHTLWLILGLLSLCVVNLLAYRNINQGNLSVYLACVVGIVIVFCLIHGWMDKQAYKLQNYLLHRKET